MLCGYPEIKHFVLEDFFRYQLLSDLIDKYHSVSSGEMAISFLLESLEFKHVTYTDVDVAWIRDPLRAD